MQKLPHQHFRLGILALDAAHVITPDFFAVYIGHEDSPANSIPVDATKNSHSVPLFPVPSCTTAQVSNTRPNKYHMDELIATRSAGQARPNKYPTEE